MVNVWESVDAAHEARQFCDIYGLESTVLLDESGEFIGRTEVRGVPFNLVVGEDGVVLGAGLTHPEELTEFLESRGLIAPEAQDVE